MKWATIASNLGINKATSAPFRTFRIDRKPAGFP